MSNNAAATKETANPAVAQKHAITCATSQFDWSAGISGFIFESNRKVDAMVRKTSGRPSKTIVSMPYRSLATTRARAMDHAKNTRDSYRFDSGACPFPADTIRSIVSQ